MTTTRLRRAWRAFWADDMVLASKVDALEKIHDELRRDGFSEELRGPDRPSISGERGPSKVIGQ